MVKIMLLAVSLFCLIPPFTMISVGGLAALFLFSVFEQATEPAVKQMEDEIHEGSTGAGTCLLVVILGVGGLAMMATLGAFLSVASMGR